jgi:quercetin dioxygenase-like cupin family protein
MANQEWPEELDALRAAPEFHRLLLETEEVRVLATTIPVGVSVPVHTHRWPGIYYIMSWSHFVRRDAEGNVLLDTRGGPETAAGSAVWTEPLGPHSVENVGREEMRIVAVELKKSARAGLDGTRVFGRLAEFG